MPERNSLLERMRVASPCPAGWESMEGDERVRLCRECNLHVYNISEMTRGEAEALLARTEGGRLCARLYRRADGTVITKDCPVGWRALRRRVARRAGAALAAVLALAGGAFGQKRERDGVQPPQQRTCAGGATYELKRGRADAKDASFGGTVRDQNGAVIAGADVFLFGGKKKQRYVAGASEEGRFQFEAVPRGEYFIEIYAHGFQRFQLFGVAFEAGETVEISVVLPAAPEEPLTGIVNVIPDEPLLDTGPGLKHVFKREQIKRLPN